MKDDSTEINTLIESLERIIGKMVDDKLGEIREQLRYIGTYDVLLWDNIAMDLNRAKRFLERVEKINSQAADLVEDMISKRIKISLDLISMSQNPYHRILAFSSILPVAYEFESEYLLKLFEDVVDDIQLIFGTDRKLRASTRLMSAISRVLSKIEKPGKVVNKEHKNILEEKGKELVDLSLKLIESEEDLLKKSQMFISFADAIKNAKLLSNSGSNTRWIDTHQAELVALDVLDSLKDKDDPDALMIKARLAYLLRTISYDFFKKSDELFDEAILHALRISSKDKRRAGSILGEVAYYKAFFDESEEAEILFEDAIVNIIMSSNAGIVRIIEALYTLDKAAKARLGNKVIMLFEDYILEAIDKIIDPFIRIGVKLYAADVLSWADTNYANRLYNQAVSELFYLEPADIPSGQSLYYLLLGLQRAAFSGIDYALDVFTFVMDIFNLIEDYPHVYISKLGAFWIGKAISLLYDLPLWYHDILTKALEGFRNMTSLVSYKLLFSNVLDFAQGLSISDIDLHDRIMNFLYKNADDIIGNPTLVAKFINYAKKVGKGYSDSIIRAVQDRIERMDLRELIRYLRDFMRVADRDISERILQYASDILYENIESLDDFDILQLRSFIKTIRNINYNIADEIEYLIAQNISSDGKDNKGRIQMLGISKDERKEIKQPERYSSLG